MVTDYNNDDEDIKEDFDNFGAVIVNHENMNELSGSTRNSSLGIIEINDSAKTNEYEKANVKEFKTEADELSEFSEGMCTDKFKKEKDAEMDGNLQLKTEEIDIKDEDGYVNIFYYSTRERFGQDV